MAFTLELLHIADQEASTGAIIDAPNLSAVLTALRDQDLGDDGMADNTLTLSSGDAFIPSVFFDASEAVFGSVGVGDIQIQNELGVQAIALGNHEFDFGTETLAGLISGDAEGDFSDAAFDGTALDDMDFVGAAFPYLSANLDVTLDANLAPLAAAGGAAPAANVITSSTVIDVNGENVAVVGATTPTLASISSPGSVGISPSPFDTNPTDAQLDALAAEIQAEVDALLAADMSLDKVILLAHMQQLSIERALAARLENVDIIVAGGSNTRLFDENDRARDGDSDQGDYPEFITNAGGTQTALVNTDGSYKYVGRLVIEFDDDGNIIADSYDATVSGAYATDAQGVADLSAENLVDPEIQAIADAIEAEIVATEGNVFGVSEVFLNGARSGVADDADDTDGVRTQETNLGNLTADANLATAQESDETVVISLKNGGGIRASIGDSVVPPGGDAEERSPNAELLDGDGEVVKPEGGISQNDIATTLAFNNDLVLMTLTGAEIVALIEHGVSALPDVAGAFPQVSGLRFSFDPDLEAGARIVNAAVVGDDGNVIAPLVEDGVLANGDMQFRIVTLGFLAAPRFDDEGVFTGGGDGYPFPNFNTDPEAGAVGDPDVIARIAFQELEEEGVQTGAATFADNGTEQDALAEFLAEEFADEDSAFAEEDRGRDQDARIQNLNFREDAVFDGAANTLEIEAISTTEVDGAEIFDFDADTGLGFATSGDGLQVIDASDPTAPAVIGLIDPADEGFESGVTSVSVRNGIIAISVPADPETDPGDVLFYSVADQSFLGSVEVGALPDMVTFNADGTVLLVANEGESGGEENEPDAEPNPDGSVSVIAIDAADLSASTVTTLDFTDASLTAEALTEKGVRINADAPSPAADLEPEFITIEGDTAFIALQENNAIAVIDDITAPTAFTIDDVRGLGVVDFSQEGGGLDPSNRDDGINIETYDIRGLRQPDAIASVTINGATFVVTANEGDGREDDVSRGDDLVDGDPDNGEVDADIGDELRAQLADDALLGRLEFSNIDGDTDGDGDIDVLHALGARSFSIFDADGNLVFDSSGDFERITSIVAPEAFNSNGGPDSFDSRSDDGGPEPEGVATGVIGEKTFAFIGLERIGGVIVYDITDPANAVYDQYIRVDGDVGPEGLRFISAADSPTGLPLLAVSNEVSETLTFLEIDSGEIDRAVVESGGAGDDELIGARGDDDLRGGQGMDDVSGGDGADSLRGGGDADTVSGGRGDDLVRGDNGMDVLVGNAGFDLMFGGRGADMMTGGRNADTMFGGAGADTMFGSGGADEMSGRNGDDIMRGGAGRDEIGGGRGDDLVSGGGGADDLKGGAGDDTLIGGLQNDTMMGGSGDDVFVFRGETRDDRIDRFEQGADLLDIEGAESLDDLTLTQTEDGALIEHDGGTILLAGLTATDLTEDDFVF